MSRLNYETMFSSKLKKLRESQQIPQRKIAAELEIDTATYCKIEKGDRRAKRDQIQILAKILKCDEEMLMKMWLADQVYDVVKNENVASEVLNIVQENICSYGK
jgi:transcriptional regulator with XRE-family HTH domain